MALWCDIYRPAFLAEITPRTDNIEQFLAKLVCIFLIIV